MDYQTTLPIPITVVDKIISVLEEHVSDFVCDHDMEICFCHEREIIRVLKEAKETKLTNVYIPYNVRE